jgi:hypothetical protein
MLQSLDGICLSLIPEDGTPVLNRVLRTMIGRHLGRLIDPSEYFSVRDRLQKLGKIGVTRGQAGKVFLLTNTEDTIATSQQAPSQWSEAKLMPWLEKYLLGPFRAELDLPDGSSYAVQDISKMGPRTGQWARPDYVLVSISRLRLLAQTHVEAHTFELKTETGGSVQAVHEALAQTRFSHFGHLVWHLPNGSDAHARLNEIEEQCELHGIGLILMRTPEIPDSAEVRLAPVRKPTLPIDVEGFLGSRLTEDTQRRLQQWVDRNK